MATKVSEIVREFYDNNWFNGTGWWLDKLNFYNMGYWRGIDENGSIELAQINLIETLVDFFPNRANKTANVLDVACGKGASTRFLTKYFEPRNVTGINISEKQLEACRVIAGGECTFHLMDATQLDFPSESFDNILCIEAACHFMTRQQFFEEARRVLKPGGRLAMSDLLCDERWYYWQEKQRDNPAAFPPGAFPKENCLPSVEAYRATLLDAGFRYARVEDSTAVAIEPCRRYGIRRAEREFDSKRYHQGVKKFLRPNPQDDFTFASCMVYAIK